MLVGQTTTPKKEKKKINQKIFLRASRLRAIITGQFYKRLCGGNLWLTFFRVAVENDYLLRLRFCF
jgi:hypothetical protein